MTLHERHGVAGRQQFDCCFNIVLRWTAAKTAKLRITGLLWGKSTGDRFRKSAHDCDVSKLSEMNDI